MGLELFQGGFIALEDSMTSLKYVLLAAVVYLGSAKLAFAAPLQVRSSAEIENSCKAKSKEIALETYRGCVTDAKTAQIEQIRREYKVKLLALKAYYENELKKMSKPQAAAATTSAAASSVTPAATAAPAPAASENQENTAADESAPDMPEPIPVQTK
jgi:hypothetical protein